MKRGVLCLMAAAFAVAVTGFAEEKAEKPAPAAAEKPVVEKVAPAKASVFVCEKCSKVAVKAGKCCGQDMAEKHVLGIKDGAAIVCACSADCKCKLADDGAKCSCGKDVEKIALKGMFVCAEGKCLTVADKAGKCACGKDLVEVK